MLRTVLLGGLLFLTGAGLALAAEGGRGVKGKGKKVHTVHGVVDQVTKDADQDAGVITIKTRHGKNKAAPGAAATTVERKVRVTAATKFFLVSGKKGSLQETPATFGDVKAGERVVVVEHSGKGHHAEKVLIHKAKKKNKT